MCPLRAVTLILLLGLVSGCQPVEPPTPPVAPMAEDLSHWSVPALVQPEPQTPRLIAQKSVKVPAGPAEKVVDYAPGVTVPVPVAVGAPLDIVLEAGEQVRQIVDGDRAPAEEGKGRRWEVKEGVDGSGERLRPHIFVGVTEAGLTNGLTVTTSVRTYYLTLQSVGKSPVRVLRWHYKPDSVAPEPAPEVPGLLPHPAQPMRYHVGYQLSSSQASPPTWMPRQVVDTGTKMFLLYPEVALFGTVPLVRALGVNGPELVNARQYLNVVMLDALYPRLELRVGTGDTAEVVTISRWKLRTITCPDDGAECPQWPTAAAALARRAQP